jgi:shikimate kinase
MLIFLIGFMGSGKSFVGKRLAERMNYQFIDMDAYILEKENMTDIPVLFQTHGEAYFRAKEKEYLKDFFTLQNTIIATGGGTPCHFDNMEQICQYGLSIYLYVHPDFLVRRLENESEKRPLLEGEKGEPLRQFLIEKTAERSVFYDRAEVIFEVKENGESIVNEIYDFLNEIILN